MRLIPTYRNKSNLGKRFYTQKDMVIIKHDVAVFNSRSKRLDDEYKQTNTQVIVVCGCGSEGCFLHHNIEVTKPIVVTTTKNDDFEKMIRLGFDPKSSFRS